MVRKAFFSFSYKKDNWRACTVRNNWISEERTAAGFFDSAEWEEVKQKPDSAIKDWIDGQLNGTTVTVVLIGSDTAEKKWIKYEIESSQARGNGMLGIYVHGIKDRRGNTPSCGANPFDDQVLQGNGVASTYPVYDWINDDGYTHLSDWIEKAAEAAGK